MKNIAITAFIKLTKANHRFKIILFIIPLLFLISSASIAETEQSFNVDEQLIHTLGKKEAPFIVEVSDDLQQVAMAFKKGKKKFVWSSLHGLSNKYSYINRIQFSPDGKRIAFMAEKKKHYYMVVDGIEYGPFNTLITDSVIFSPNSQRFAFIANTINYPGSNEVCAIVDGVKQKKFNTLIYVDPTFSSDSKHLIYFAKNGSKQFAMIDGKKGQNFEVTGGTPQYSFKDSAFIFMGSKNDTYFIVKNDSIIDGYYGFGKVTISKSTGDVAYDVWPTKDENWTIIYNNQQITKHYACRFPKFSPDGTRFAYWASDSVSQFAVVDSVAGDKFVRISDIRFSPEGKHCYYIGHNDESRETGSFVIDNKVMPLMEGELSNPQIDYSPDESRWAIAYDVDSTNERVILDDKVYADYLMVGNISFSDNSEHVAFIADRSPNKQGNLVFIDGQEVVYEELLIGPNILFNSEDDILYWGNTRKSKQLIFNHKIVENINYSGSTFPMQLKLDDSDNIIFYTFKESDFYKVTISKVK